MEASYAIVRTGGKQYRVAAGDRLVVEKLEGDLGDTVELSEVLMAAGGSEFMVGEPLLENAKVVAEIEDQRRGKKINGFTYKPKKNEHRRYGHRQWETVLRIQRIEA